MDQVDDSKDEGGSRGVQAHPGAPVLWVAAIVILAAGVWGVLAAAPGAPGAEPGVPGAGLVTDGPAPTFSSPVLIDPLRAGGEPVIAATDQGTLLVAAHPGHTHVHPTDDPVGAVPGIAPTQGQSYLWRSTDGGATWTHVSLAPVDPGNTGPRGLGQGDGDPDLTIDGDGRIYLTDLAVLAEATVSWSDDDGQTWLLGNNVASQGPVDRQWLASDGSTVYLTGNYFTDRRVLASQDGLAFQVVGFLPQGCGGDMVSDPTTGTLYTGCGDAIAVSSTGGSSWHLEHAPVGDGGIIESEPAIDAAGTVYLPTDPDHEEVHVAATADQGESWQVHRLDTAFPELAGGSVLWPWASAGSEGRVAVTFYGSPVAEAEQDPDAPWYVYTVIVTEAHTSAPTLHPAKLTPEPVHVGSICQSGTTCQLQTAFSDQGDRRLGDFFETTVSPDGRLHVVYSDTQTQPGDWVSHVGYVGQTGGPLLIDGDVPEGFPRQG